MKMILRRGNFERGWPLTYLDATGERCLVNKVLRIGLENAEVGEFGLKLDTDKVISEEAEVLRKL